MSGAGEWQGEGGGTGVPALLLLLAVAACAAAAAALLLELLQARLSDLFEVGVGHGGGFRCVCCGLVAWVGGAGAAKVVVGCGEGRESSGVRSLVGQVP